MKQYILEYAATENPEQMQKSQGMVTEKEEKELTEIWRISIEEDKARKDFAVNSASRISRTTLPAVKSKGKPARRKTEKGYLKGRVQKKGPHSGKKVSLVALMRTATAEWEKQESG